MRLVTIMLTIALLPTQLVGSETKTPAKIDTLIQEPGQAGDLPEAVVRWLEARDYLIPLADETYYSGPNGNTLAGSFTGENKEDCAALTILRGAIEDSCRLWVFPSGDTLSPLLVGTHLMNFRTGTQWWPPHGKDSPLGFAWRISPFSQNHAKMLEECGMDIKDIPEITHAGIRLGVVDKGGGWYYYYNDSEWMRLPSCD
jgi:hypothetical protein